jgi:hypothetical protein
MLENSGRLFVTIIVTVSILSMFTGFAKIWGAGQSRMALPQKSLKRQQEHQNHKLILKFTVLFVHLWGTEAT